MVGSKKGLFIGLPLCKLDVCRISLREEMQSEIVSPGPGETSIAEAPPKERPPGKRLVQTRCRVVLRLRPRQDNDAELLETVDNEEV